MSHREEKDRETRRSESPDDVGQKLGKKDGGLRNPQPRPAPRPLGQDEFPGKPRKTTKKDAGFEPDPDVEAGHD
jgi:hypothetical protein